MLQQRQQQEQMSKETRVQKFKQLLLESGVNAFSFFAKVMVTALLHSCQISGVISELRRTHGRAAAIFCLICVLDCCNFLRISAVM